jgi:hypothetical protein
LREGIGMSSRPSGGPTRALSPRAAVAAGSCWLVLLAIAPRPARAQVDNPPPANAPAADLVTRYRFIERYTTQPDKAGPGVIGPYQVAFKSIVTVTTDNPRGAPDRRQYDRQVITTEQPAELSGGPDQSEVTALIRRYEKAVFRPDTWTKMSGPKPLEGLSILFRNIPNEEMPEVLILNENRRLLEKEYRFVAHQPFVPDLAFILPEAPVHVNDAWPVPREGAGALIEGRIYSGALRAKLAAVRPDAKGTGRVAVIRVSGRLTINLGETAVNSELEFHFTPPSPPAGGGREEPTLIDARGAIMRASVAQTVSYYPPGQGNDRRLRTMRRELVLERRLGNPGAPLTVPKPLPKPTEANSWLLFVDDRGRFHFLLPQSLVTAPDQVPGDRIMMGKARPDGSSDMVVLTFWPNTQVKPEAANKDFFDQLRNRNGVDVDPGASQTLPEADWPKMRVTRTEAAARLGGSRGPQRLYLYSYVAQLSQNASVTIGASTVQDPPTQFRKDVEDVLRSFKLGLPGDEKEVK